MRRFVSGHALWVTCGSLAFLLGAADLRYMQTSFQVRSVVHRDAERVAAFLTDQDLELPTAVTVGRLHTLLQLHPVFPVVEQPCYAYIYSNFFLPPESVAFFWGISSV